MKRLSLILSLICLGPNFAHAEPSQDLGASNLDPKSFTRKMLFEAPACTEIIPGQETSALCGSLEPDRYQRILLSFDNNTSAYFIWKTFRGVHASTGIVGDLVFVPSDGNPNGPISIEPVIAPKIMPTSPTFIGFAHRHKDDKITVKTITLNNDPKPEKRFTLSKKSFEVGQFGAPKAL